MPLVVNTNLASLSAQRNLAVNQAQLSRSVERLSSGLRITRAADDAAGLGVSETLRAQIRSINQANRNAGDGISLTQVADGAAASIGSLLARMRELATQSASGTLGSSRWQKYRSTCSRPRRCSVRSIDAWMWRRDRPRSPGSSLIGQNTLLLTTSRLASVSRRKRPTTRSAAPCA